MASLAEGSATLLKAIFSLRESGKDSDLVLECGGKTWSIHKFIIRAYSSVLAKELDPPWKRNPISLPDDVPCAVQAMVDFMYTSDYSDSLSAEESIGPMQFNVLMYTLADKFDIQPLARLPSSKFETQAKLCWQKEDFAHAIEELYNRAPDKDQGMRDTAVVVPTMHAKDLLNEPYGVKFRRVVSEVTVFGAAFSISFKQSKRSFLLGESTWFCVPCRTRLGSNTYVGSKCPHCKCYVYDGQNHRLTKEWTE